MKELVVISGKGGTGKTSIAAALVALATRPVCADCDVDAANMHLLLTPEENESHVFYSGHIAHIETARCTGCGVCKTLCRFDACHTDAQGSMHIDPYGCEGCGICVRECPAHAITFLPRHCGTWIIGATRFGPLVHAQLGTAAENSGKLVMTVRQEARRVAKEQDHPLIIIDGPPGLGCPVMAAINGATQVLVVTEPTVSGMHDLDRILSLTAHFSLPTAVCVNKWDINPAMTEKIEKLARNHQATIAGRIRYDPGTTRAQLRQKTIIECACPSAHDIRSVWRHIGL